MSEITCAPSVVSRRRQSVAHESAHDQAKSGGG